MTEAEWLSATDPLIMLASLLRNASERKLRLFAVGCCRSVSHRTTRSPRIQTLVGIAEAFADGGVSGERMAQHRAAIAHGPKYWPAAFSSADADAFEAAFHTHQNTVRIAGQPALEKARAQQADLLRCIFGNPFRPVALDPGWRTSTVVALAEGIYEDRAFDRLPILADALQDAGCENEELLSHCRGDGPHARGCWVVDMLLGKG